MTVRTAIACLVALFAMLTAYAGAAAAESSPMTSRLGLSIDVPDDRRLTPSEARGWLSEQKPVADWLSHMAQVHSALETISREQPSKLRGRVEVELYARTSPSILLVVTEDGFGSGSLVDSNGLVLTNAHVVQGAREVGVVYKPATEGQQVTAADVRPADVIRIDEVADLALLRVRRPLQGITALSFGLMKDVAVGADVHAIGHPTGETWTYTKGVVSQIRRKYTWSIEGGLEHQADVIQTQTPINPGNSGGPLLNDRGQLVGVNSFVSAQATGLNFAVAVSEVQRFMASKGNRLATRAEPECEVRILSESRSTDPVGDIRFVDVNCDGKTDFQVTSPDSVSEPQYISLDTNGDGSVDAILVDENRDERIDYSFWDVDWDGKPDMRGYHPSGEWEPDRVELIEAG